MYEYLALVKPGSNDYLLRILFDTTFYVWTGILLLNVVTGLMVDTFGAVREEKERRKVPAEVVGRRKKHLDTHALCPTKGA